MDREQPIIYLFASTYTEYLSPQKFQVVYYVVGQVITDPLLPRYATIYGAMIVMEKLRYPEFNKNYVSSRVLYS